MVARWFRYLLLVFIFTGMPVLAKTPYTLAPIPQPVSGDKVEVLEFFWYGCNHCEGLDPKLTKWMSKHSDIVFRRIHTPLASDWVSMTKAFYALNAMGQLDRLHSKIFDAMHRQMIPLDNPEVLFEWIAAQGIDKEKFKGVFNSFAVQTKVRQAEKQAAAFRLTGVPAVVVDRKYITSLKLAGDDIFNVLDQLVAKAQADRAKAK